MNTTPSAAIYYQFYTSPLGQLLLIAQQNALIGIEFEREQQPIGADWIAVTSGQKSPEICKIFAQIREVLDRYFAGEKIDARNLPLKPRGTAFQQAVWQKLLAIPYGATSSYGQIAAELGKPQAMRAIGGAVGRNPISILIPCHRVLAKGSHALTGFGGGLPAKRYLLKLEGVAFLDRGIEQVSYKAKKWGSREITE